MDDMERDLRKRDPAFEEVCQNFIAALRRLNRIIPFERCWVPAGYRLLGFVTSLDGGKCRYGSTTHVIAEKEGGVPDTGYRRMRPLQLS